MEISDYFTGESQKEKIHGILEKTKVPYQGSWKKLFTDSVSVIKKYLTDSSVPIEKIHVKGGDLLYGGLS